MARIGRRRIKPAPFREARIAVLGIIAHVSESLLSTLLTIRTTLNQLRSGVCLREALLAGQTPVEGLSQSHAMGGRLLLLFTGLLLAVMPMTEYYWHFDRFLRGGEDLEFGILFVVTILSLAIVLSRCRRQTMAVIHAVRRWIAGIIQNAIHPPQRNLQALIATFHTTFFPPPLPTIYNLPLQI
jgi:hypothetical protein